MIEFEHEITQPEVDTHYINLTDKGGNRYGSQIGKRDKVFKVVDDAGKEFEMKRHGGNQLTGCTAWYNERAIKVGAEIKIRFDPHSATIYLLSQPSRNPPTSSLLGSVSLTHDGDYYEIRCIADGEVVRVSGFRDGKQVGGFDFPTTPKSRRPQRAISDYI